MSKTTRSYAIVWASMEPALSTTLLAIGLVSLLAILWADYGRIGQFRNIWLLIGGGYLFSVVAILAYPPDHDPTTRPARST